MKHCKTLTKRSPVRADSAQELICVIAQFLTMLLGSFGGAAPSLDFLNEKCDNPEL